jgi:hypothetical protein
MSTPASAVWKTLFVGQDMSDPFIQATFIALSKATPDERRHMLDALARGRAVRGRSAPGGNSGRSLLKAPGARPSRIRPLANDLPCSTAHFPGAAAGPKLAPFSGPGCPPGRTFWGQSV